MDARLVMFRPSGQRKDFPLVNPVTVIGRGENCDLRIPLLSVSRRHCELRVHGEALKVKDLASSNGTYVNNGRVTEVDLSAGDRLAVGPVVFTLQIDGRPEEILPVKSKGQKMAESGGDEEELDPEVVSQPGASSMPDSDEEDVDPIAALEALGEEPAQPEPAPAPKKGKDKKSK
jgi:pSer/pThr/pTyr-binding forkhead associated (FHA) protein